MDDAANRPLRDWALRAISCRDKCSALIRQANAQSRAGEIDGETRAKLVRAYTAHALTAEAALRSLRRRLQTEIQGLSRKKSGLHSEQLRIQAAARQGKSDAARLNESHRVVTAKIDELDRTLEELKVILAARHAKETGGFIEMPLDAYLRGIPTELIEPPTTFPVWPRWAGAASAMLALVALFLPWLRAGGVTGTLVGIGLPLQAAGAFQEPLPAVLSWLWVLYALVPMLIAAGVSWRWKPQYAAWAAIAGSLVVMAAAFMPLSMLLVRGGFSVVYIVRGLQPGMLLYLSAGFALLVTGAKMRDTVKRRTRDGWRALLATVVVALLAVGAVLVGGVLMPKAGRVEIACTWQPRVEAVRIVVENPGRREAAIVLPWPTEGRAALDLDGGARVYGVILWVRMEGEETYQRVSDATGVWNAEGASQDSVKTIPLAPGLSAEISLDSRRLSDEFAGLNAIRLDFVDGKGNVFDQYYRMLTAGP